MHIKDTMKKLTESHFFQALFAFIFILPLVATTGQFQHTGHFMKDNPISILFWPGSEWSLRIPFPAWLLFGLMALSYITGICWLIKRRTFGKVVLLGMLAIILANLLGGAVNHFTGWREMQNIESMDLTGRVDLAIMSLWYNPLWEEVMFRGIPLLLALPFLKKGGRVSIIASAAYIIIPSIITSIYHIPNHGPSRIVDTFIIAAACAYIALQYSFFAPLVLHYIFDAMMIINMGRMKGIPQDEVVWLVDNNWLLNTAFSVCLILIVVFVPVFFIWHYRKSKKQALSNIISER